MIQFARAGRARRALGAVAAVVVALVGTAGVAAAVDVETLPGEGWLVTPDQTAGGSARLVEGPATPPAGRGSLELGVQATTDLARVANLVEALPADSPDRLMSAVSGTWSTYVPVGTADGAAPTLQLPGFLNPASPAGTFTTLNVEPRRQGTITPGAWQTWTLGPTSIVWHTNTVDGFCLLATPCTFAEFAAHYPTAAWGGIQFGIGSGVPGPVVGHVDDVRLAAGTTALDWNFDIPVDPPTTTTSTTSTTAPPATSAPTTGAPPTGASTTPAPTPGRRQLPATGTATDVLLPLALLLLATGAGLVALARTRPAPRES